MFIILLIIFLILMLIIFVSSKRLKIPCVCVITGDPKTGKSWLSTALAVKSYRRNLLKYYFRKYLLFKKDEKPCLYSNIPLRHVRYKPLTFEHILRLKRFEYGSIILINEASLVADSQNFTDKEINDTLTLFFKLIGHETRGGKIFLDTQNLKDVHFSIKRCVSSHIHIHNSTTFMIPFFGIMKVREMTTDEDGNTVNISTSDLETTYKKLFILKKWWKYYDRYCYSVLTDNLDTIKDGFYKKKKDSLKTNRILCLRPFKIIRISSFENKKYKYWEVNENENPKEI